MNLKISALIFKPADAAGAAQPHSLDYMVNDTRRVSAIGDCRFKTVPTVLKFVDYIFKFADYRLANYWRSRYTMGETTKNARQERGVPAPRPLNTEKWPPYATVIPRLAKTLYRTACIIARRRGVLQYWRRVWNFIRTWRFLFVSRVELAGVLFYSRRQNP